MAGSRPAPTAILELVLDRARMSSDVQGQVRAWVEAGVDWLQIRERGIDSGALFAFARDVLAGARSANPQARVLVNRRVDVALATGADGVHLGFDAMAVQDARALLGPSVLIGVSCHAISEVQHAADDGADYVHLAPIFDPISKPATRAALGLDVLKAATRMGVRVIGQGGLDESRAGAAVRVGAAGVAVTGPVLLAHDPLAAVRALRDALDRG
jgi:thiamine-phosphate pyrophosphorylase